MNIKQLRLFHEVMVTGKISAAAERLNFSQPAASKMLANLESRLGYSLFARGNGRLNATPEAVFLHEETLGVLHNLKRLEDSFDRAKHGLLGKVKIASIFGPSFSFLPQVISAYTHQHPGLKLSLQVFTSSLICEEVASGQFELGLVDKSFSPTRYHTNHFELPCYCAIHRHHPAAKHEVLSPALLDGESWITFDPENNIFNALKQSYQTSGKTFNPGIEVNASLNALAFVYQQCGVAMIDAITAHHFTHIYPQGDVIFRQFAPHITEPLTVISTNSRPLSKPARELHTLIIKQLEFLVTNLELPH
jgi:DNA-binding transcriptional LysR family regulator